MSLRITIAEDEEDYAELVQLVIAEAFSDADFTLLPDAEGALQHILAHGTDVLITDQRMRAMTGVELIHELRAREIRIPIIMLSGNVQYEPAALREGATRFLSKGLPLETILDAIRECLPQSD